MNYVLATLNDLPAIRALMAKYHRDTIAPEDMADGFVTTALNDEQFADLIVREKGVMLAKDGDTIAAFALAASWDYWQQVPIMQRMIDLLPQMPAVDGVTLTWENTYQYGPVCVDKPYRGTGVFEGIFHASLHEYAEKYPVMVTFVNQINPRSHAAHTRKVGMREIATFDFNGNHYWMLAIPTT